jgi:hypothetical protein
LIWENLHRFSVRWNWVATSGDGPKPEGSALSLAHPELMPLRTCGRRNRAHQTVTKTKAFGNQLFDPLIGHILRETE